VPSQPIRLLIGYPPGGAVDILMRVVGEGMQRVRNVAAVPEVRSGAYGFIGAAAAPRRRTAIPWPAPSWA